MGTLGTWSSGGFVADGALAGRYELGLPDAAIASGARWVIVCLRGAANMLPVLIEIELDAVNYQSAAAFITGVNSLAPPANWNLMSVDGSGRVTVGTNADKTGYSLSTAPPTAAQIRTEIDNNSSALATLQSVVNAVSSTLGTVNNKIGGFAGAGLNTILGAFRALLRKDAGLTPSDVGGTFDNTTDSLESLRERGDTAWITADLSVLAGYTDTLESAVAAVQTTANTVAAQTDTLETSAAALQGYTDSLEAGVAAVQSAANAAVAQTDTLEASAATLVEAVAALPTADDIATEVWTAEERTLTSGAGSGGDLYGESGSIRFTYTVFDVDGTTPLPSVAVYASADDAGEQRSQIKITDDLGRVVFDLVPGAVWFWRSHPARLFDDPDQEEVNNA